MICRRPHPPAFAVAAALALILSLSPVAAPASNLSALDNPTTDLVFSSTTGISATPPANGSPQVVISLPYQSITPSGTDKTGSPLSIDLAAYNGQTPGFDATKLLVGFRETAPTKTAAGQDELGLSFLGSGLAPGGQLIFKLNKGAGWTPDTALSLETSPNAKGDTVGVLPAPTTTTVGTTVPTTVTPPSSTPAPTDPSPTSVTKTPEPASVALWSVVAGALLLRARKTRRRK